MLLFINGTCSIEHYFATGGLPRSTLAGKSTVSFEWRKNFITTFLERDLL
jgi:predicted AAA+ superfamily ATPase